MSWWERAGKWITGEEHETEGDQKEVLGETHTDTVHYDERGERDSGKLKVSGPKHDSHIVQDVIPPKK
jgi:hypothetical protein